MMDQESNQKGSRLEELSKKPGFWGELVQQLRLIYYLLRDPEVPFYLKLIPLLGILYVVFPIDLVPDLAPVVGQIDDITALLVGAKVFIELSPQHLVMKYMHQMEGGQPRESLDEMSEKERKAWEDAIVVDAEHEMVIDREPTDQ